MKASRKCVTLASVLCAALGVSTPAHATTEHALTIAATGAQLASKGYIRFASGPTRTDCPHGVVYIDLSTDGGRARMSIAITARASGQTISRVDYTNDGGHCWVDLLEI